MENPTAEKWRVVLNKAYSDLSAKETEFDKSGMSVPIQVTKGEIYELYYLLFPEEQKK